MEETMMMSRSSNGSKPHDDHHENTRAVGKPATVLSLREDSHSISKPKSKAPKIRIVHIFAPEIIKTDASNFRELVQRLTGKPSARTGNNRMKMSQMIMKREFGEEEEEEERGSRSWEVEESSGGYLSNLGEFEGFFQGLANDYSNSIYASIDI